MNQTELFKYIKDLEKRIKPTMTFDKTQQYGDYITQNDGSKKNYKVSKSYLMKQMKKFIPEEYRHLVVWIKHHFEASTVKVKDDNYEMFGLTKDKIGTVIVIPEHWTLGWKYTPKEMLRKTLECDKLVEAKS